MHRITGAFVRQPRRERASSSVVRRHSLCRALDPPPAAEIGGACQSLGRRSLFGEAVAQTPAVVGDDNGSRDELPMDSQESTYTAEEALSGPPPLERPTTTERFRGFVQQPPRNSALGHRAERPTAALFLSPDSGRAAARQHICA